MGLAEDVAGFLPAARSAAESIMTDACRITRETAGGLDEATGKRTTVSVSIYTGPCRFKAADVQVNDVEQSGQQLVSQNIILSLPIGGSESVTKGDIVRITASATDPGLVGKLARVEAPFASSYSTARRFPVVVLT